MGDKIISIGNQIIKMGGGMLGYNDVFTPYDITNMIAWYDSKDLSTISKDGSDYISQWNDKSGNNYHLAQATALNQPLYSATNGIVFDGTNDYMNVGFGVAYSQPITVFIVVDFTSTNNSLSFIVYDNKLNEGSDKRFVFYKQASSANIVVHSGSALSFASSAVPINKKIYTVKYNGVYGEIYENNILKASGSIGNTSLLGWTIGRLCNDPSGYFKGGLYEHITYNKSCSEAEIILMNNHLNAKYSIY